MFSRTGIKQALKSGFRSLASGALDWLYPRRCMICEDIFEFGGGEWFCATCEPLLEPIKGRTCERCGRPLAAGKGADDDGAETAETETVIEPEPVSAGALCPSCLGKMRFFGKNTAFFTYDPVVRELIHRFKYGGRPRYALGFARMICGNTPLEFWKGADAFIPVPMYPKKQRERGFNQAEELAEAVSRLTGVPVVRGWLVRAADTRPQSGLNPAERANNVRDAFKTDNSRAPSGKSFLLFDDIFTTGETMSACAKVLLDSGAERVEGFTLAVTTKRNQTDDDFDSDSVKGAVK